MRLVRLLYLISYLTFTSSALSVQYLNERVSVQLIHAGLNKSTGQLVQIFKCKHGLCSSDGPFAFSWFVNSLLVVDRLGHDDRFTYASGWPSQSNGTLVRCIVHHLLRGYSLISGPLRGHLAANDHFTPSVLTAPGLTAYVPCQFLLHATQLNLLQFYLNRTVAIDPSDRGRHRLVDHGLLIRNVEARDRGAYSCCLGAWCAPESALLMVEDRVGPSEPSIVYPTCQAKVVRAPRGATIHLPCYLNTGQPALWLSQRPRSTASTEPLADGLLLRNLSASRDGGTYACLAGSRRLVYTVRVDRPGAFGARVKSATATQLLIACGRSQRYTLYVNAASAGVGALGVRPAASSSGGTAAYQCVGDDLQVAPGALVLGQGRRRRARSLFFDYDRPPKFTKPPDNVTASVDSEAFLHTLSRGADAVDWYFDGRRLDVGQEERHSLIGSGTLRVRNVSLADAGVYTCVISNPFGNESASALLTVEGAYEPSLYVDDPFDRSHDGTVQWDKDPSKMPNLHVRLDAPDVSRLSNTSVLLRWQMPSDDQLPAEPLLYRVQYKRVSPAPSDWELVEENLPAETRSYILSDLEPGQAYKFRYAVIFKNLQPVTSRVSKKLLLGKAQGAGVPTTPPDLMTAVSKWPNAIELKWDVVDSGDSAPIDGFIVQYRRVYSGAPVAFQNETVFGGETRSHMLDRLLPATPYEVRMVAFNAAGASAPCNSVVLSTQTLDGHAASVSFLPEAKAPRSPAKASSNVKPAQSLYKMAGVVFGVVAVVNVIIVLAYAVCRCRKGKRKKRRRAARSFRDTSIKIFKDSKLVGGPAAAVPDDAPDYTECKVMMAGSPANNCRYAATSFHCLMTTAVVEREPLVSEDRQPAGGGYCTL